MTLKQRLARFWCWVWDHAFDPSPHWDLRHCRRCGRSYQYGMVRHAHAKADVILIHDWQLITAEQFANICAVRARKHG